MFDWGPSSVVVKTWHHGKLRTDRFGFQKELFLGPGLNAHLLPAAKSGIDLGNNVPRLFRWGGRCFVVCPLVEFGGSAAVTSISAIEIGRAGVWQVPFVVGRSKLWEAEPFDIGGAWVNPARREITTWGLAYSGGSHAKPERTWTHFDRYRYSNGRFALVRSWRSRRLLTNGEAYLALGAVPYADRWAISPRL